MSFVLGDGRSFKSTRPDQFLTKPAKSSLPGHLVPPLFDGPEPSARRFKSGLHPESFEISRLRRSRLVHPASFSNQSATLNATRSRGRTLIHEADD
jgi:hypothetical protein